METAEPKRYRLLGAEGGKGMSVLRDNRETGLVTVIAAERDCINYCADDPDRCSADRCLCLEIVRFLPPWLM